MAINEGRGINGDFLSREQVQQFGEGELYIVGAQTQQLQQPQLVPSSGSPFLTEEDLLAETNLQEPAGQHSPNKSPSHRQVSD